MEGVGCRVVEIRSRGGDRACRGQPAREEHLAVRQQRRRVELTLDAHCAGDGRERISDWIVELGGPHRSAARSDPAACNQHLAARQQSRGRTAARADQGMRRRRECAGTRIVELGAARRRAADAARTVDRASDDQHFPVRQEHCSVVAHGSRHVPRARERSSDWIVELGTGVGRDPGTAGDEHLAALENGGGVSLVGAQHADRCRAERFARYLKGLRRVDRRTARVGASGDEDGGSGGDE